MPYKYLPRVKSFCGCIHNLRTAGVLIAFYSLLRAVIGAIAFNTPVCEDTGFRHSGLGFVEHILAGVVMVAGLAFGLVACFLCCNFCCKMNIPELYVTGVFVIVPLTIAYWGFYFYLYHNWLAPTCQRKLAYLIISVIFGLSIVDGCLLLYFAIVINSYEKLNSS